MHELQFIGNISKFSDLHYYKQGSWTLFTVILGIIQMHFCNNVCEAILCDCYYAANNIH